MKTKMIIFGCLAFYIVFLTGCGGSGIGINSVNNEYLNKLPSIAKEYNDKIEAKEKEIHECTDMNDAFKLEKELSLLKEEWEVKIKESNAENPITKPLPFESMANLPYKVNQITVESDKVYKANMTIKFDVALNQDIKNKWNGFEKYLFIYFLALDQDGKEIPGVISVAMNSGREELKSGFACVVSGQLGPLAKLEHFAKLKLISKEEYDKKKK